MQKKFCKWQKRVFISASLLLLLNSPSLASQNEAQYISQWCNKHHGRAEVTLPDRSRADCITESHAVEVEFAPKWKESIGQSLNYAMQTNKRAGVVVVMRRKKDYRYWLMLNSVIKNFNLPIDSWLVESHPSSGDIVAPAY